MANLLFNETFYETSPDPTNASKSRKIPWQNQKEIHFHLNQIMINIFPKLIYRPPFTKIRQKDLILKNRKRMISRRKMSQILKIFLEVNNIVKRVYFDVLWVMGFSLNLIKSHLVFVHLFTVFNPSNLDKSDKNTVSSIVWCQQINYSAGQNF
jgi:hypothetical protein